MLAFVFCYNDILSPLEGLYRDKVYQRSRGVNQSIKIIAIDGKTLDEYGPFGTWDRKVYADVLNVSPMGMAAKVLNDTPSLLGKDVIVVAETLIMYADVVHEDENADGTKTVALNARKFTNDVLKYLFEHITEEE